MGAGGGCAGDVKEPLPLYFEQRALLGWAVQGDGAAVMMVVDDEDEEVDEDEKVQEEERSKRRGRGRGRAWCWWCGRMGSTAARIGRCVCVWCRRFGCRMVLSMRTMSRDAWCRTKSSTGAQWRGGGFEHAPGAVDGQTGLNTILCDRAGDACTTVWW